MSLLINSAPQPISVWAWTCKICKNHVRKVVLGLVACKAVVEISCKMMVAWASLIMVRMMKSASMRRKMMKTLKMMMITIKRLRKTTFKMKTMITSRTRRMMIMIRSAKMKEMNAKLILLILKVWSKEVTRIFTMALTMRMNLITPIKTKCLS